MTRRSLAVASLALCLLVALNGRARATNGIRNSWNTYYPTACQTLRTANNNCTLCHDAGANDFNAYGLALIDANRSLSAVDGADSDHDGRTNHQEIVQDCTFPGDTVSPVAQPTWGTIKAIYR